MNISSLTPTWFSFLVVTYNFRDLESNPTTATNPSCGVGKSWYLSASVLHLTNVANAAFCIKSLQTAVPHEQRSALQPHQPGRSLGAGGRLQMPWAALPVFHMEHFTCWRLSCCVSPTRACGVRSPPSGPRGSPGFWLGGWQQSEPERRSWLCGPTSGKERDWTLWNSSSVLQLRWPFRWFLQFLPPRNSGEHVQPAAPRTEASCS